jgi:hypothetical protein
MRAPDRKRTSGTVSTFSTFALAALLLGSPIAEAQWVPPTTRCVGDLRVSPCTAFYPDLDSAYAAANNGDTLLLTTGTPPARLKIGKRLIVRSHAGFVLSDLGLRRSATDYVVQVVPGGEGTDLRLRVEVTTTLESGIRRPTSAGGIFLEVDSDVLAGSAVFGPGKIGSPARYTDTIGIRVNRGTGSKTMRVLGSSADPVLVTGFGRGIFIDNPSFHVTSYVRAEKNGIGLQQRWGRGQNFYGIWKYNDVAIEMQAVHHNDTNGHTFDCNGIALKSSMTEETNPITGLRVNGPHLEYNFHVVKTENCAAGIEGGLDVLVQKKDGSWEPDRTQDPGAYIQYSTRKVDGVLLPTWKTGEPD